ncbi:MAG: hypothetical protein J3K34DRAFT_457577 [Monoraphidium minutum]|nr:MAG: hypothetical protein J3K34DRAFT_457577 [Monoraphidium minutum]
MQLQAPTSPSAALPHADLVRGAAEAYACSSRSSLVRLQEVWQDIELPQEQQVAVLEDVISRAHAVWADAVAAAEGTQQRLRAEVEAALREIAGIKEELGDDVMRRGAEAELGQLVGEERVCKSLCAWRADVLQKAQYWRNCRLQRMGEYDELQERREERVAGMMSQLRGLCSEVGEDAELAAGEVHASLALLWDSSARQVLRDVYKLAGAAAAPAGAGGEADLSDATLGRLAAKLDALAHLKARPRARARPLAGACCAGAAGVAGLRRPCPPRQLAQRAAHASELTSILHSLWDACAVGPAAPERAALSKLMAGPLRMHTRSLEKCMAEVRRCEDAKVAQMLEIVNGKARELVELCSDTHIAPPDGLGACIAAINAPEGRSPGAAADLLTKLVRMLSEVQVVAAKRSAIIGGISELEEARREEAWLLEFEGDEARYKGRDANKKLQRAIKAQKCRERLPAMAAAVRGALAAWREAEGAAFLYDGRDYDALLAGLEQRLEALAAEKAAKTHARRQSGAGGTPGPADREREHAPPGRASPAPAALQARTPLPKGMSGRQLQERHSIAVVGSRSLGATGQEQAQAMRSSGQLPLKATPAKADARLLRGAPPRTPPPAGRTPSAKGAAGRPPAPAASPGPGGAATPASDRLAVIFNKAPLPDAGLRTPTPDAAPVGGGGGDQGLGAAFQRLVVEAGSSGGKDGAAAAATPPARGGDQGSSAKATPPSGARVASRIPQPQF